MEERIEKARNEALRSRIKRLKRRHKRYREQMKVTLENSRRDGQSVVIRKEEYKGRVKIIEYRPRPIISARGINAASLPNLRRFL